MNPEVIEVLRDIVSQLQKLGWTIILAALLLSK